MHITAVNTIMEKGSSNNNVNIIIAKIIFLQSNTAIMDILFSKHTISL